MQSSTVTRRSSRLTENVHPNLKRKATAPIFGNSRISRPVLKNLTNANNVEIVSKSAPIKKESVQKNVPNYLRPTYSTLQKCVSKNEKHSSSENIQANSDFSKMKTEIKLQKPKKIVPKVAHRKLPKNTSNFALNPVASQGRNLSKKMVSDQNLTVTTKSSDAESNCFGFDGEENDTCVNHAADIPESVASPCRIEITPSRKLIPSTPKPPVNKVLSVLKSSISTPNLESPRTVETKLSQYFTPSTSVKTNVSPVIFEPEVSFEQPPRRSYTRQKPVKNFAEFDEASSDDEDKVEEKIIEKTDEKKKKPKEKSKQDKKFDELAAAMNSQFSEIEKFLLVVE